MFPQGASGGSLVRIRAITVSVIHILSWSPLGAGDGGCVAHAATLQERVKSSTNDCSRAHSLPPFVIWNVTPELHWSQLKDSPSWRRTLSQTHEAYVCRIYARAEPPLRTFITRISKVWQYVSGGPWWTHWSVEFSCRKNEELLFTQVQAGEVMHLHPS